MQCRAMYSFQKWYLVDVRVPTYLLANAVSCDRKLVWLCRLEDGWLRMDESVWNV